MEADKTQKLLKEKLKEKGLKVTHQRLLVLSVLEENSGSHMTAEDIYDLVSEDIRRLGLPQYTEHCSFCGICSW